MCHHVMSALWITVGVMLLVSSRDVSGNTVLWRPANVSPARLSSPTSFTRPSKITCAAHATRTTWANMFTYQNNNCSLYGDEITGLEDESRLGHTIDCSTRINDGVSRIPLDCEDVYNEGATMSGVYQIFPVSSPAGVSVYCQMEGGQAWTVFLCRDSSHMHENFTRPWQEYKTGFGSAMGEYWLGNDNLHSLTGGATGYRLKVEGKSVSGYEGHAEYEVFSVADEGDMYRLSLQQHLPAASNINTGLELEVNNGMAFTTFDEDNDLWTENCGIYLGGGWWYKDCSQVHPTSPHGSNPQLSVNWYGFDGTSGWIMLESLKMMVRRR